MITAFFLFLSWLFLIIGLIGIIKNKDTYSRLLIAGLIDSMASISILFGLIFFTNIWEIQLKLVLLFFIMTITNPITIHSITRAYYISMNKENITNEEVDKDESR